MKIITYNVNGIRAAIQKGLLEWISREAPDVLLLQETKAQPDQLPLFDFEMLGYRNFWHCAKKKGYSGVAVLTRRDPDKVVTGMGIEKYDSEGRFLRADFGDVSVISVYHPSGTSGVDRQAFKMEWLNDFYTFVLKLRKERPNLVISGDYNICHKEIDIHDPRKHLKMSGFLPEERDWMSRFLETGFLDSFRYFNHEPNQYTWWSFLSNARARNLGWRIDYHMVTTTLEKQMTRAAILKDAYHSDHCPVLLEIDV